MGTHSPPRWTEEQLQEWMLRRGTPSPTQSPPSPPRKKRVPKTKTPGFQENGQEPAAKKRRGVDVKPIIDSVKNAQVRVQIDPENGILSILFDGARLLSLNELFSIMQFRKYEAFRYKSAWRHAINKALGQVGPQDWRHVFPGAVKMTLFRRSAKYYDLDSPLTPFKFAIDALAKHVYWVDGEKRRGVIVDDNRTYVPEMNEASALGKPMVGLRLERSHATYQPLKIDPEIDWFQKSSRN